MKTSTFLLLACAATLSPVAFAQGSDAPAAAPGTDVLVFNNGDKLTGKLKSAAEGKVVFHPNSSAETDDMTIPFAKIKELNTTAPFVALRTTKPGFYEPAGTGVLALQDDQVTLTPGSAEGAASPKTITTKDISYLVDADTYAKEMHHGESFRRGWLGSATAGFTLVRSTQSSTVFTGALDFIREIPSVPYLPKNNRTTIDVTESFGKSSSPVIPPTVPATPAVEVKTNIFHGGAEYDKYLTPHFYALGDLGFDHNYALGLQLQQVYGVGVGWTPLEDARQELDLKADIHYERQAFIQTPGAPRVPDNDLIGSIFQENYHLKMPRKAVLTEWANFIPSWNDSNAYAANAFVGLALPVSKKLAASISATDNYLNNPAPFYHKNSVQLVMGLTYAF